jgi:hypothetical protein
MITYLIHTFALIGVIFVLYNVGKFIQKYGEMRELIENYKEKRFSFLKHEDYCRLEKNIDRVEKKINELEMRIFDKHE